MIVHLKPVIKAVITQSVKNREGEHYDVLEVQLLDSFPFGHAVGQAGGHLTGNIGTGRHHPRM